MSVVRDSVEAAHDAGWTEIARSYGIENRTSPDGEYRGLTVGGPVAEVAAALDAYRRLGIGELIFVFRHPFDLETIERLGEIRDGHGGAPLPGLTVTRTGRACPRSVPTATTAGTSRRR